LYFSIEPNAKEKPLIITNKELSLELPSSITQKISSAQEGSIRPNDSIVEYGPLDILEMPSLVFNRDDVSISKPNGFKNDSSLFTQTIITEKTSSPRKMVIFF